jgi:hypothetical protein
MDELDKFLSHRLSSFWLRILVGYRHEERCLVVHRSNVQEKDPFEEYTITTITSQKQPNGVVGTRVYSVVATFSLHLRRDLRDTVTVVSLLLTPSF